MAKDFKLPGQHVYDGMRLNFNIPDRSLDAIKNGTFEYRNDDVIVCGYPKSGNHWLINTVLLLQAEDIEDQLQQNLWKQYLMLEAHFFTAPGAPISIHTDQPTIDFAKSLKGTRVFLSHLPAQFFTKAIAEGKVKFIVPIRNVKDVVVSWYKHQKVDPGYFEKADIKFHEFFDLFISGNAAFGHWFDNIASWEKHKNDPNVLIVPFEENILNHEEVVQKIAKFLGCDADEEKIKRVTSETLFANMKANKNRSRADWMKDNDNGILRRGKIGGWKEEITIEQSEILDKMVEEKLKNTSFSFIYE